MTTINIQDRSDLEPFRSSTQLLRPAGVYMYSRGFMSWRSLSRDIDCPMLYNTW